MNFLNKRNIKKHVTYLIRLLRKTAS